MADTIKKAKLAAEDIHFDAAGTGSTVSIPKSDGNFRAGSRINAGHIPIKTATRGKTRIGNVTSTVTDVDSAIAELYDDLEDIGTPDDSTLQRVVGTGILQVKDDGIGNDQLAANSVDSDQYIEGSIDNVHLNFFSAAVAGSAASGGKNNVIQAASIDTADLADAAVQEAKIDDNAVTEAKIAAGAVTPGKLDMDGAGNSLAYFPIFAGVHSDASLSAAFTRGVAGVKDTDVVIATVQSLGTYAAGDNELLSAAPSANTLTFTMRGAQTGGDTKIQYVVYRATGA